MAGQEEPCSVCLLTREGEREREREMNDERKNKQGTKYTINESRKKVQ
jgi:hypothetical protein